MKAGDFCQKKIFIEKIQSIIQRKNIFTFSLNVLKYILRSWFFYYTNKSQKVGFLMGNEFPEGKRLLIPEIIPSWETKPQSINRDFWIILYFEILIIKLFCFFKKNWWNFLNLIWVEPWKEWPEWNKKFCHLIRKSAFCCVSKYKGTPVQFQILSLRAA